ncbi:hypothetical protein [Nostoc commune]|uniref:hypothetical protein n=1 Tax=Nostoc commune TaxID=1178 RepID=UPI0020736033|nr:hypothetical protein [Nostoc commune]
MNQYSLTHWFHIITGSYTKTFQFTITALEIFMANNSVVDDSDDLTWSVVEMVDRC